MLVYFFHSFCIPPLYCRIPPLCEWHALINVHIFFHYVFDLATVITSRTRLEVLTLFIRNPALELGIRETARRLDANLMLVRHELILLQAAGLLKSRRVANSIQFSLDTDCSAVEPLRALLDSNGASTSQTEPDSTSKSRTSNKSGKTAAQMTAATDSEENFDD